MREPNPSIDDDLPSQAGDSIDGTLEISLWSTNSVLDMLETNGIGAAVVETVADCVTNDATAKSGPQLQEFS